MTAILLCAEYAPGQVPGTTRCACSGGCGTTLGIAPAGLKTMATTGARPVCVECAKAAVHLLAGGTGGPN